MKFYITTPIYYINGDPHIGHAYASIAADIIARFMRLDGAGVRFCTGTDEHGIKVARSAEKSGLDVQKYADIASQRFRDMGKKINLSNDDFIRTTEERHIRSAQAFWKLLEKDLYKGKYVGWYDPRDEAFVPEDDIVDGKAPSGGTVEWMEEESYFFKLSAYQDKLLKYYEDNPDFIGPSARRNEIISFVKSGLRDLSVSRSKFSWGIPVPGDEKHVMYVWIDALANYLSSVGFPDNVSYVNEMMEACTHIVGKEILRFHAVYWPAFLMSAGVSLPKRIFAHGWWTCEGQKMSKSIGNVVDPIEMIDKYGLDQVRYFLFRSVRFGDDGDFSEEALRSRISYDLANDLGNLVQRVLAFIQKSDGVFVVDYNFDDDGAKLVSDAHNVIPTMRKFIGVQNIHAALETVWKLVSDGNRFVAEQKPWELAKQKSPKLNSVLTALVEAIRVIAFGAAPFMPDTARKIFDFISAEGENFSEIDVKLQDVKFPAPSPLFPKEK